MHYNPSDFKNVIDFTIGYDPKQTNVSVKIKNGISLYKLEIYGIINAPPKQYLGTSQQTFKNVFSLLKKKYTMPTKNKIMFGGKELFENKLLSECGFNQVTSFNCQINKIDLHPQN